EGGGIGEQKAQRLEVARGAVDLPKAAHLGIDEQAGGAETEIGDVGAQVEQTVARRRAGHRFGKALLADLDAPVLEALEVARLDDAAFRDDGPGVAEE